MIQITTSQMETTKLTAIYGSTARMRITLCGTMAGAAITPITTCANLMLLLVSATLILALTRSLGLATVKLATLTLESRVRWRALRATQAALLQQHARMEVLT